MTPISVSWKIRSALRLATGGILLGVACTSAGCAAAAFAPLAVQAAQAVGSGVLNAAANHAAEKGEKKEDFVDKRERCDNLEEDQPAVIELRAAADGQPMQWREVSLNNLTGDPMWTPAIAMGTAATWRPVENLLKMNFNPPLSLPEKPGDSKYLIYAASEPKTAAEQDQLTGLSTGFASLTGTFQWDNRAYQYAMVEKLPCFPIAQAMK